MTRLVLTLLFSLTATTIAIAEARTTPAGTGNDSGLSGAIDAAVAGLIQEKKTAGVVVLVAKDGKVLHVGAYGERRLGSGDEMSPDTIFRIHSMTKAIVSAAALQQMERGMFTLEDPVSKFLPEFTEVGVMGADGKVTPAEKAMTVRDLFLHTSGLAYGFTAPKALVEAYSGAPLWGGTSEKFCTELAKIPLVHEPGMSWRYGVNTDVLGRLIEIWSGQSLDRYLKDEIFGPLEMHDTAFWIRNDEALSRFADVHQTTKVGVEAGQDPLGQIYREKPKMMSGGGGLVSSASDYYQFLQMIADGGVRHGRRILRPETVDLMTTNQLPDTVPQIFFGKEQRTAIGFGLGFSVVTGPSTGWDEAAPLNEFGWGGAASCHYWVSPDDDDLIVITLEQTTPYNWNLERTLKPVIYGAIRGE